MNFRSKHWSVVAVLAAVVLALTGLTSSATAATARTVTLSASPTSGLPGHAVTFSGSVTKSPKGSIVKIQRKTGSTWTTVSTTKTTTSGGAFKATLSDPTGAGGYYYRAGAAKTSTLATAYSRTVSSTVLRPTTATLSIDKTSLVKGQSAAFSGTVSVYYPGRPVVIQRQSGSSWVNVATTTVSAGTYTVDVTPDVSGLLVYRANLPVDGLNAPTVSSSKTLTVTDPNAPVITTTSLPDGDQYLPYNTELTKTGGAGTWSVPAGTLPGGITLGASTGVLSGTPTGSGSRTLAITFTETSSGLKTTKNLPITINPGPVVTTTTLPDVTQGVAYSTTLAKTGRPGTWSVEGLPSGLNVAAATGIISGTTSATAGTYGVYATFTETDGARTAFKALALKVLPGQVNPPSGPTITTTSLPNGDQYLAYTVTLAKTGGAGTWSVPAGTLPGGITLDPATGVLSGTPTGSGSRTLAISFTETGTGLKATKNLPITINPAPAISTTSVPDATRGVAYRAVLELTPSANGTWTVPGLPSGLSVNQFGVITGTTNVAPGEYGIYPKFVEAVTGRTSQKALSLRVVGTPLAITTDAALPDGHKNLPYSVTFTKTGSDGTWSGQVPDGFTLNPTTGTLTGTPATSGLNAVYITFTENGGGSVFKAFSLNVLQPKITTTSIPDGVTGTAYSQQFTKTGLDGTWEVLGLLPDAFTFSSAGLLSGTPTETGDYQLLVRFTETSTGVSSQQFFILHVAAPGSPTITTTSLPDGKIGTAYSATLAATPAGGTWSITTGSLPVGLSLNPTTGAITGTPVVAEDARFVVTYTNGSTKNTKYLRLLVPTAP